MIRYALAWLTIGAIVSIGLVVALRSGREGPADVALPPVQQPQLQHAARAAGCELRRVRESETASAPAQSPPRAEPARPGIYERSLGRATLAAATRRGIVVLHYRPHLQDSEREELQTVQRAVPAGTILAPNPSMPYELAAEAYRRLLGCTRYSVEALDAVRLFRGRYLGRGPDAAR